MRQAMSVTAVSALMALESKKKKMSIWITASIIGVISLIFAALYLARFDSVAKMQEAANNPDEFVVYDTLCYGGFAGSIPYTFGTGTGRSRKGARMLTESAQWTDVEAAESLMSDIRQDCDEDCLKLGS